MLKLHSGSELFDRYYKQAVLFELIGGLLLAASIAINYFLGHSPIAAHICLTLPGVVLLILGGSSARPHNTIRAFAQLLTDNPNSESAQALLAALTRQRKISLVNRTIHSVYTAIDVYAHQEDADQELLEKLQDSAKQRISKKIL